MKRSEMVRVAKLEMRSWRGLSSGFVLAILFSFIHRITTGETVEETFFGKSETPPDDYQI